MSRFFDGQNTTASVTFSPGNSTGIDQGPFTVAVLLRFDTTAAGALTYVAAGLSSGGGEVWALIGFDLAFFLSNDFNAGSGQLTIGPWYWVAATKGNGASTVRWHIKNVTSAGAWSHANETGTVNDGAGPVASIVSGNSAAAGTGDFRGWKAAEALWSSELTDLGIEAACTLNASDLVASNPVWGVLWNQSSTATSVSDFTGGGGNQTAISATSVDAAQEPPGWSYALSGSSPAGWQLVLSQAVNRSYTY